MYYLAREGKNLSGHLAPGRSVQAALFSDAGKTGIRLGFPKTSEESKMLKNAEDYISPELLEFQRQQSRMRQAARSRLTIQDFEAKGIDVVAELWKALQRIEDPKDYMDAFLKILKFVFPTINAISIQADIREETPQGPVLDLEKVGAEKLVQILRGSV